MKRRILAVAMAAALTAGLAPTVLASSSVVPFTAVSNLTGIPSFGVEKDAGRTIHVYGLTLVNQQTSANDMVAGTMTVTVSYVFGGGRGNAMWGTEVLQPTAFPG